MKIFTFWEPSNNIPAYLKLCMETWSKHIPDAEITLLDYSNINAYIDTSSFLPALTDGRFSLPQIADALRCMLLEKYGGIWMDCDTIILNDGVTKYLAQNDTTSFFCSSKLNHPHIAFINTYQHAQIMEHWKNETFRRIHKKSTISSWDILGNDIINSYIDQHPEAVQLFSLDEHKFMPERIYSKLESPVKAYEDFYFKQKLHISDIESSIVLLHNSWTPKFFRNLSREEFLNLDCTLSNLLAEALDIKRTPSVDGWSSMERQVIEAHGGLFRARLRYELYKPLCSITFGRLRDKMRAKRSFNHYLLRLGKGLKK